jgi:hypothetical protein
MTGNTAFRLSRIYAEGWNTANKLFAAGDADIDPGRVAALNPYAIDPEKARWHEGFTKALRN